MATASRWRAYPMARSVSAIAGTPKGRFSDLPQTNGTLSSEACETENLTVSAGSDHATVVLLRPARKSCDQSRSGGPLRNPGPSASRRHRFDLSARQMPGPAPASWRRTTRRRAACSARRKPSTGCWSGRPCPRWSERRRWPTVSSLPRSARLASCTSMTRPRRSFGFSWLASRVFSSSSCQYRYWP